MSRIGKQFVSVPAGVSIDLDGRMCTVKGPKGELRLQVHDRVTLTVADGNVSVAVKNPDEKRDRALWGLFRVLVSNLVEGVTKGFQKQLEIRGIGYRATIEGQDLVLNLGYSHPVRFPIPAGIAISLEKNVLTITGADKQLVGETAAKIRRLRLPEPYKGKGIRYVGERVRQKAGKVVKAAGAK